MTKLDARQVISRDLLAKLTGLADSELDNLLRAIDSEVTPPLNLKASNPVDLSVSVGSAIVQNPESLANKTIPHIGSLLPNAFSSGSITFPAASGGTITVAPGNNNTLTVPSNEYIKVLIYMDANGDLNVLPGVPNAVEATASVLPPPRNTLPIGYVTLFNNAGTIDNVAQSAIFQFGTGAGGGGGAGDANDFVETLKNRLNDSIFEAVTPYIAENDQDDAALIDVSSTGVFDLVSNRFKLTSIGDTLVSANLLDADFLAGQKGIDKVEVVVKFDETAIDTAADYEVSRNGGDEWQTVTMERVDTSDTFRGFHTFADEAAFQTLNENAVANADATEALTNTVERLSQIFTVTNLSVIRELELYVNKLGTPLGNYFVSIIRDDAGDPSTDPTDIVFESELRPMPGLAAGDNTITFNTNLVLDSGSYHIVFSTDAEYKTDYSAGVDEFRVRTDASAPVVPVAQTFNGTVWADVTGEAAVYKLDGIELDLRLRITSSVADALLEGFGVLYEQNLGNLAVATTVEGITRVSFQAVADNLNQFLLPFLPNPDLLIVHLLGSGQSFRFGDFSLQGNTVVFPVDQFNNGGIEKGQTLIFDQIRGGAFDNSDANAVLLANNHLGSTDAAFDKSVAGRGIFLRKPNGQLVELTINDANEIEIYSV